MLTAEKDNTLQMKGNSGIMLQSRYEVQVLDLRIILRMVNAFTKTNEWK